MRLDAARGMTLRQAIFQWAPESDGNNPGKYLADVISGFHGKVSGGTLLVEVLKIAGE